MARCGKTQAMLEEAVVASNQLKDLGIDNGVLVVAAHRQQAMELSYRLEALGAPDVVVVTMDRYDDDLWGRRYQKVFMDQLALW